MNKKRIFAIIGLVFAFIGVICVFATIFWQTENNGVLNIGLASTFIAFIIGFILNRKGTKQEDSDNKNVE